MVDVDVRLSGPLFDGRAEKILDSALDRASAEVAEKGAGDIKGGVARAARNPSGRYASRVVTERTGSGGYRALPRGLRYIRWLEGTAVRNRKSRFKGYRIVEKATRDLQRQAPGVAEMWVDRAVKEING